MRKTWRTLCLVGVAALCAVPLLAGCSKDKPSEPGPAGVSPDEKNMTPEEMQAWGKSMAQKAKSGQLNIPQEKMGSKSQAPAESGKGG